MSAHPPKARPLVMHLLYRLDTGGLENGVINLVNHMPESAYRHCIVSLTEATDFQRRIRRPGVEVIALHKPPGHAWALYPALWRLFRSRRPAILHTRNLAALEAQVPALLARVPVRIHGEHGRDVSDLDGSNPRYRLIRKVYRPFVQRYVALSRDLGGYLTDSVGVSPRRVVQIYNGVDTLRFAPSPGARSPIPGCPFTSSDHWLIGTVGRMQAVKAQQVLAEAFIRMLALAPGLADRARLVMVGDGPLRAQARAMLDAAGLAHLAWLPGERTDIPEVMRGLDCFVLPSLAEGISNTILEAMACALPVVATRVGGNPELVTEQLTGVLVPNNDAHALARSLFDLAEAPMRARTMGLAGRAQVLQRFSLNAMVSAYQALYDESLALR